MQMYGFLSEIPIIILTFAQILSYPCFLLGGSETEFADRRERQPLGRRPKK